MSTGDQASTARGALDALDLGTLSRRYSDGTATPLDVVAEVHARIEKRGDDAVWIATTPRATLEDAARTVQARRRAGEILPLFGIPFAVKDNIDVAGIPTTAACPAFAYTPDVSARAVARLVAAGAIVVGKTNMDQFASGLVGVRSPYGIPRNPFDANFVAGGSSSGSAVAVAVGEVSFALGTDTAGSGRVPAAYNNIVGLKPSRGVISAAGVVPACRSLDCVSVFAATCEDAARVAELMRGYDPADPFARPEADSVRFAPGGCHRGPFVLAFRRHAISISPAIRRRQARSTQQSRPACGSAAVPSRSTWGLSSKPDPSCTTVPSCPNAWRQRVRLWREKPEALVPPLRSILEGASRQSAGAVFSAQARLRLLRIRTATTWQAVDFLLLPTAPTLPRIDAVESDPLGINASLGRYSNFANLLDLAALAVPTGFRGDGLPAGVTLAGPWGSDGRLAGLASRLHRATSARIGATPWPVPAAAADSVSGQGDTTIPGGIPIAVVGAHLTGEPLNHELTSVGGKFLRATRTKPRYRLFALPGTTPPKPGLVRTPDAGGAAIDVEVWELSPSTFGVFVVPNRGAPVHRKARARGRTDGQRVSVRGARHDRGTGYFRLRRLARLPPFRVLNARRRLHHRSQPPCGLRDDLTQDLRGRNMPFMTARYGRAAVRTTRGPANT